MTFLSDILARKQVEVAERRKALPEEVLERNLPPSRGPERMFRALAAAGADALGVIAEVKRASPSVGSIDASVDAVALASQYASAGAAAISVLTDGPGFGGSLEDLRQVREKVEVPLLRKDFIVDRYQLLEARAAGADAVLLIVAALRRAELHALHRDAQRLGLDVLVEVHDEPEVQEAIDAGARMIGINNRDLRTFQIDLGTSEKLLPRIPSSIRAVAESGVRGPPEAARLWKAGARNFLIGEALVRSGNPKHFIQTLRIAP